MAFRTGELPQGHPQRQPWYEPPDPDWSVKAVVDRVRERLQALDPKLNVWWWPRAKKGDREQEGRWAIMYWMARGRIWSVVYYWEDAAGGFRPLEVDCAEPILNFLRERCEAKPQTAEQDAEQDASRDRKAFAELNDACARFGADALKKVNPADAATTRRIRQGSPHHDKFLRSRGLLR